VWAGWDGDELRVRIGAPGAAPRWHTTLVHSGSPFRSELVTLHVVGDLVVGTLHHPSASWTQAFAVGLADGALRWRHTVTGLGPIAHSAYLNRVASRIEGPDLVIQGVETGGAYLCTVELATGRERACVDGLAAAAIVVPADPVHLPPPKVEPPRPLGPRTTAVLCKPSPAAERELSVRRESAVNLVGSVVTPSTSCAPTLSGGIAGDRIELNVDDRGPPAAAPCECRIVFKQDYRPESQTIIVTRAGEVLVRQPVPGWP